jgi:hypothetical protein
MIEFLQTVFVIILLCFMIYGCWVSSVILSERSKLRKLTGAYYDYEIEEALKEMQLTRDQALDIVLTNNTKDVNINK